MPEQPKEPAANAAAPETPLPSRFQAQMHFGLIAGFDFCMFGALILLSVVAACWKIFGVPDFQGYVVVLLLYVVLLLVWLIGLIYRVLVWVLDMRSEINLMPDVAARMAAAYLGGKPPTKK